MTSTAGGRSVTSRHRGWWKKALLYVTLILVAVVMVFPGFWMWVTAVFGMALLI